MAELDLAKDRPAGAPAVRAPLVAPALALALGVMAGRLVPLGETLWAMLAGGGALAALAAVRSRRVAELAGPAVLVAILAAGAWHVRLELGAAGADDLATYVGAGKQLATLRGRVITFPKVYQPVGPEHLGYRGEPRTHLVLRAEKLRTVTGWAEVSGRAAVVIRQPARHLSPGQRVELIGWLTRFAGPRNPGSFDAAAAARLGGLHVRMTVPVADGAVVLEPAGQGLLARAWWRMKASARQHLAAMGEAPEGDLLNALITGQRSPGLSDLDDTLRRAGLAHFLSISGLHLGIFLGMLYLAGRAMLASPRLSAGATLAVLVAYVILAEPRAPVLRAAIMAGLLLAGQMVGRRAAPLNALAAALIVLLIAAPAELISAGFQLSFLVVAGLIVLTVPIRRALFGWLAPPPLSAMRRRPPRWQGRVAMRLRRSLADLAAGCLAAFLAAAPLTVYHFHLLSPWAPLLTMLALPWVAAILAPGYLSLALAWPVPHLSARLGGLAAWLAGGFAEAAARLDALPALCLRARPVPAGWVVLAYAALLAVVFARSLPLGRWLAGLAVVALVGVTVATQAPADAPPTATLDLLAVGDGQVAVLRCPSGATYLIDAGTLHPYNVYQRVIAPYWRDERLGRLDGIFLSHANTDHYNALPDLVRHNPPRRAWLNQMFATDPAGPPSEAEAWHLLRDAGAQIDRLHAGQVVTLDDRTRIEVLWPPEDAPGDLSLNDTSLVLRAVCDGKSVLLPGDLDERGQGLLLAAGTDLHADVLVLPHHGSWTRHLPRLIERVAPRTVLCSASHDPQSADPRAQALFGRLDEVYRYYSTARNGWLRLHLGRGRARVETMR